MATNRVWNLIYVLGNTGRLTHNAGNPQTRKRVIESAEVIAKNGWRDGSSIKLPASEFLKVMLKCFIKPPQRILMNNNSIAVGKTYFFTKSGNQVRVIEPSSPYKGQPCWTVERTNGRSAGKRMIVPAKALVNSLK